jgi:hypothetical protein
MDHLSSAARPGVLKTGTAAAQFTRYSMDIGIAVFKKTTEPAGKFLSGNASTSSSGL